MILTALAVSAWGSFLSPPCQDARPMVPADFRGHAGIKASQGEGGAISISGKSLTISGSLSTSENCPVKISSAKITRSNGSGGEALVGSAEIPMAPLINLLRHGVSFSGKCEGETSSITFEKLVSSADRDLTMGDSKIEKAYAGSGNAQVSWSKDCFSVIGLTLDRSGIAAVDGVMLGASRIEIDMPSGALPPSRAEIGFPALFDEAGMQVLSASKISFYWSDALRSLKIDNGKVKVSSIIPLDISEKLEYSNPDLDRNFTVDISLAGNGNYTSLIDLYMDDVIDMDASVAFSTVSLDAPGLIGGSVTSGHLDFIDHGILRMFRSYSGKSAGSAISGLSLPQIGPISPGKLLIDLGSWIDQLEGNHTRVELKPSEPVQVMGAAMMAGLGGSAALIDAFGVSFSHP